MLIMASERKSDWVKKTAEVPSDWADQITALAGRLNADKSGLLKWLWAIGVDHVLSQPDDELLRRVSDLRTRELLDRREFHSRGKAARTTAGDAVRNALAEQPTHRQSRRRKEKGAAG